MEREPRSRLFVKSVVRAFRVLQALADSDRPLTLSELADALGYNKVTTSRFCYTLTYLGYLERIRGKRYRLAPKILGLGYAVVAKLDLRQVGEPYLRNLSRRIQETVNMAVLDGNHILYVARFKTEEILPTELHIGSKLPIYCTSMGKVILAHLPPDRIEKILSGLEFIPLTHRTLTSADQLRMELETVRRNGYAVNDEELSVGLRSIAAPIMRGEEVAAAINIAVSTAHYSLEELISECSDMLKGTANAISQLLQKQVTVQKA